MASGCLRIYRIAFLSLVLGVADAARTGEDGGGVVGGGVAGGGGVIGRKEVLIRFLIRRFGILRGEV
jgi:hypothetical protein